MIITFVLISAWKIEKQVASIFQFLGKNKMFQKLANKKLDLD